MDMSKAKSIVVPGELARGCMDRMKMSEPQFARLLNLSEEELEAMGAGALRKAVKEGDSENGCFMAGESCALVTKIQPAAEIIRDVVTEGEALLKGAMQWVK